MQDIIKSIKAYLYDRSSSPLLGAFVCSWLVWNYKLIVIILASEPLKDKLVLINNYWDEQLFWGSSYILFPLILTIFYVFIYPYIALPVYRFSLGIQRKLRETKQTQENEMLLSVEESRDLRIEIARLKEQYMEETLGLQKTIKSQNEKIVKLETISKNSETNNDLDIEISSLIKNKVSNDNSSEFSIKDLFSSESWKGFSESQKDKYSQALYQLVRDRELGNISIKTDGKGLNKIYIRDKKTTNELSEIEIKVLLSLTEYSINSGANIAKLSEDFFFTEHKAQLILDNLEGYGLVEHFYNNQDTRFYKLTPEGRNYLDTKGLLM